MIWIRFFAGLAFLLLLLLIARFIKEPFAIFSAVGPTIEAVGVIIIGLIWGLLFWVLIRFFNGPNRTPDPERFIFYVAMIVTAIYIVYHAIF